MTPKQPVSSDPDLFRSRLEQIIDLDRPLVRVAERIDWAACDREFGALYHESQGRPGLPTRLMVGLTYLSRIYDLSDEEVVECWLDNPYWQYFCGFDYFQHDYPLDPSSLVRWRKRIGEQGVEFLLQQTIETAKHAGKLNKQDMSRVNVDTTVQEKAIRFPTDARLYHRMRERLVKLAQARGVKLRQSYKRVAKKALLKQGRYAYARQMKRAARETKKLKTMLGRVQRDIVRKAPAPDPELAKYLGLAARLFAQQRTDKNKLYSVHEPDVECIAKGKAHKRYEFGCKVGVVTTSRRNWVVGAQAFHTNPYDGHTLADSLAQMERLTGWEAGTAYADLGYRGHGYTGQTSVDVVDHRKKRVSKSEKKWRKRRAAIEPVIGHLKTDHRMLRNMLKGKEGDNLNVMLAGCGFNLRKLVQVLLRLFRAWPFIALLPRSEHHHARCELPRPCNLAA